MPNLAILILYLVTGLTTTFKVINPAIMKRLSRERPNIHRQGWVLSGPAMLIWPITAPIAWFYLKR